MGLANFDIGQLKTNSSLELTVKMLQLVMYGEESKTLMRYSNRCNQTQPNIAPFHSNKFQSSDCITLLFSTFIYLTFILIDIILLDVSLTFKNHFRTYFELFGFSVQKLNRLLDKLAPSFCPSYAEVSCSLKIEKSWKIKMLKMKHFQTLNS